MLTRDLFAVANVVSLFRVFLCDKNQQKCRKELF